MRVERSNASVRYRMGRFKLDACECGMGGMELQCSTKEFIESFKDVYEAFYWLGGASCDQVRKRDAALADGKARVRPCYGLAPGGVGKYMVFDVETDGGAGKQLAIQIGYVVFDENHAEVFAHEKLLKLPPGKKINWHSQKVHKISDNKLFLRGVDPRPELVLFFEWVERIQSVRGGRIIAHNAAFDASVVTNTAEMNTLQRELSVDECFCTMRRATDRAGLTDKRGRAKPPRNSELYEVLHGNPPLWAKLHDALDDCRVTACSYREAAVRGWW